MKKKLLLLTMLITFCFAGCGKSYQEVENLPVRAVTACGGYFTVIKQWNTALDTNLIVYANDTKVEYLITKNMVLLHCTMPMVAYKYMKMK